MMLIVFVDLSTFSSKPFYNRPLVKRQTNKTETVKKRPLLLWVRVNPNFCEFCKHKSYIWYALLEIFSLKKCSNRRAPRWEIFTKTKTSLSKKQEPVFGTDYRRRNMKMKKIKPKSSNNEQFHASVVLQGKNKENSLRRNLIVEEPN